MSGIYGNSKEDRYFESICDKYTNENTDRLCNCKINYDEDDNGLFINDYFYDFEELEDKKCERWCPECGNSITL